MSSIDSLSPPPGGLNRRARRSPWLLLPALFVLAACGSTPGSAEPAPKDQALALKDLHRQEQEIARFARGLPDLAEARVMLRSHLALLILTPAPGRRIGQETLNRLNAYITKLTGLKKEAIQLRQRRAAKGER